MGANGCGKTTIIECLKYAITGQLPPGCNLGQSFVHDPKVAKAVETLGQVKLRVSNIQGQKVTVSRPVKCARQKNSTLKFSALQPSVDVFDPTTGEEATATNRCLDASIQMCITMGTNSFDVIFIKK